jgi:hypothetical protein
MSFVDYWIATNDGQLHRFGIERVTCSVAITDPVALTVNRDGSGCALLGQDGRVEAHGTFRHHGDLLDLQEKKRAVDIASMSSGDGYWIIDEQGNVFAFGDAQYFGGVPQVSLHSDLSVCIRSTPSDDGYWIVDRSGGICGFGNIWFNGALADHSQFAGQIVDFAPEQSGRGYFMLDNTGRVHAIGDIDHHGDASNGKPSDAVAFIPGSLGYLIVDRRGAVLAYGDSIQRGSVVDEGTVVLAAGGPPVSSRGALSASKPASLRQ